MNKARIKNTDEIVLAEELPKLFPNYKELVFVCVDNKCSIRMAPACIKKSSKRRPHFKKYRNQEHIDNCEYAVLNDLYQKGKDQKLTNIQINKIGYPSVFHIKEKFEYDENEAHIEKNDNIDEGITGRGEIARLYEFDSENIKFDRRNKVQSIDRIVDWYLGFPYNRDVEIEIKGNRIEYQYFFKKIKQNTHSSQLHNERIFYGRIMLSNKNQDAFDKYNESVYLTLLGFQKKDEISGQYENYSIKVNKNSMSRTLLSKLKNKYNELFKKAFIDFQEDNIKPDYGLYAFVYGKIDEKNNTILNVEKHHITFRYDEVRKTMKERDN
ncbi:hypothetical protein VS868_14260 [Salinimicrobium sp. 3283s]|uniref:hypothetical protein n=1 Tax=Salinimicrobium sp. 3283s TaxID=3114359 RepID=UPI0031EAD549